MAFLIQTNNLVPLFIVKRSFRLEVYVRGDKPRLKSCHHLWPNDMNIQRPLWYLIVKQRRAVN